MSVVYPLKVSKNGRYFVDQNTIPYLIMFDSGWPMTCNMTTAESLTYMDTRKSQNFNGFIMEVISHSFNYVGSSAPGNQAGDVPFITGTDSAPYTAAGAQAGQLAKFSTPVDAFFAHAEAMVDAAAARGLLVLLYAMPWGFDGDNNQGWYQDIIDGVNTQSVCRTFGQYLATGHGTFGGFASKKNIIWMHGSDYGDSASSPPTAEADARMVQLLLGLADGGCTQLRGGDWNSPSLSTDQATFEQYMQVNGVYSYGGIYPGTMGTGLHTYQQARAGWNYVPVNAGQSQSGVVIPPALPAFEKETAYENSPFTPGAPSDVRKAQWWCYLSGGTAGVIFGNVPQWEMEDNTNLVTTATSDMTRMSAFVQALPWWNFVPSELSGLRRLITSANGTQAGTPDDYVAAVQTTTGTVLLAYVPTNGTGAQNLTVDLSSMIGRTRARWWDPTNGLYTNISGGAYNLPNTAGHAFTTPGNNSAGDNDWLLLIETPAPPPASFIEVF